MTKTPLFVAVVCTAAVLWIGCNKTIAPIENAAQTASPAPETVKAEEPANCKTDAYDPAAAFPINENDPSGNVVTNCSLDENLQPVAQTENCWNEIRANLYDGGAECLPDWHSQLEPEFLYDGPVDIPVPDICRHHCVVGLPGTQFVGDKALCRVPSGNLDLPAAPRGYRCMNSSLVDSRELSYHALASDYNRSSQNAPETDDNLDEVITKINTSVAGFVCADRYMNHCLCGGKDVPAGTVCNADQVVQICENPAGCACGDVMLSAGMYCDRGKAWCGTTAVSANTTGFSCLNGELYCTADSCTRDGQTLTRGTVLLSDKPLILACLESSGCEAYHKSLPNQAFILNDTIYNDAVFVQPDALFCGDAHIDENASGFTCLGNGLACMNESCTLGKHTVSKGTVVWINNLDLFHASNPDGTGYVVDGVTYTPRVSVRLTQNKSEIFCDTEPTWLTQAVPGSDYVCSEQGWVCDKDKCNYYGMIINRGDALFKTVRNDNLKLNYPENESPQNPPHVLQCLAEDCLCGTQTIATGSWCVDGEPYCKSLDDNLWAAPGKGLACVQACDDAQHRTGEPCDAVADEDKTRQFYCDGVDNTWKCGHFAWVCQDESCNAYGKSFVKGDVVPKVMSNGMLCTANECTCGASKLPQNRQDMICENDKLFFQCGSLPRMEVTSPDAFPFQCYDHLASNVLKCVADRCSYGNIKYKRDEICSDKHCIREFPIPESALLMFDEEDCSMGQCASHELKQLEWMSELLRTDGEVCVDGNCKCGENVCGKLSYCKDGQCYCGSTEEPNNPDEESGDVDPVCVSMKVIYSNHYGLREVIDEGMTGEWYEVEQ